MSLHFKGDIFASGNIETSSSLIVLSGGTISDNNFSIQKNTDANTTVGFDANGTAGTFTTMNIPSSVSRTLTLPDTTDTLVSNTSTQSLTNKTIVDATNNVNASGLLSSGGDNIVRIVDASEPSTNQLLRATSNNTATWQTVSSSGAKGCLHSCGVTATTLTTGAFTTVRSFIFPGTTEIGTTISKVLVHLNSTSSVTVSYRIQDISNSQTIASDTAISNNGVNLHDLGTISNVPTGEAIFEFQGQLITGTSCDATGGIVLL